jgi:signal transduction histidine kinase
VTNAVDAIDENGGDGKKKIVTIKTIPSEAWGIEYRVEDTGVGMGEETLKKIFQGFFSTKGTMGSGLGLMMSKKIVDRHGGQIEVSSQKGAGTTFIVRLPRRSARDDEATTG